jgi:hypothetical protein
VPEGDLGEPSLGDCGDPLSDEINGDWLIGDEWLVGCMEVFWRIFAIERSTGERVSAADRSRNVFIRIVCETEFTRASGSSNDCIHALPFMGSSGWVSFEPERRINVVRHALMAFSRKWIPVGFPCEILDATGPSAFTALFKSPAVKSIASLKSNLE